jgi:hypothetical protein
MSSTFKKVVVVRFNRTVHRGYVDPGRLGRGPVVDLLTEAGERLSVPLDDISGIYFVRNFEESFEPERKVFLTRPRMEGLWVRLRLRDGLELEGIVPNDLLALLDSGVHLTPPDLRGNTVRLFIPRSALVELKVLGVVGASRRPTERVASRQQELFGRNRN